MPLKPYEHPVNESGSEGVGPRTPGQWPATGSDGFNLPWALYVGIREREAFL